MDNHTIANSSLADNEIIARILQGEKDLYALLMRRYNQRLYRVSMSIINNDTDAEEAMQLAYIKAYENLGKFQFKSSFATWLTRILINECLLRLKKKKQSLLINTSDEVSQQYSMHTDTPYNKILNVELKKMLEKAIHQLPEKYRTVFIMREVENMSIAETQACLDITEVNVKVRLSRAKALLRDTLSVYYQKEDILHFHLTRCDGIVELVMKGIG
jgi:RNA polymerase sigma factor (sigma-70 family)